jgi:hypothetical protein
MANIARNSLLFGAALGLSTATAQAQSGDSAVAQALFDQAKELMASGHGAEACPKLEESQRLDPHSGTLINLASCYELTKRLASAWSAYIEAASAAKASGNPDRESVARQRAATLAPRLSKLTISVAPALQSVPGLEVTRDGVVVRAPEWGVPLPADAGEHAVTANAPGHQPFQTTVKVAGERTIATVNVPDLVALPPEPPPPPAPVAAVSSPAAPPFAASTSAREKGLGTGRTIALVAGGVGVVGVALGTAFGLASKSKHNQSNHYCSGSTCWDQRGVDDSHAAQSDGNISTALMIVGAVGLAAGVTLWFSAPNRSDAPAAQVGLGFGTLQVKGAF